MSISNSCTDQSKAHKLDFFRFESYPTNKDQLSTLNKLITFLAWQQISNL